MQNTTSLALASNPRLRYVPPLHGKVKIKTTEGYNVSDALGGYKPISNSQVMFAFSLMRPVCCVSSH